MRMIPLLLMLCACADQNLIINEIMAWNESTILDGELYSDWIELYNPGPEQVSLSGYYLTNEPEDPFRHKLAESLTIESGGFLMLWASGDTSTEQHLAIKLSKSGDSITLYHYQGEELELIDSYAFTSMSADISSARHPDGGEWVSTSSPTPGASNQ